MEEIWKDIEGYEGYYQVSNLGRVRSLDHIANSANGVPQRHKGKILKQSVRKLGYMRVHVSRDGVAASISVHRLVAAAFCERPDGMNVVNHIDNNPSNNRADNLEWTDYKGNMQHAAKQGRMKCKHTNYLKGIEAHKVPVVAIAPDGTRTWFESGADAARSLGIPRGHISPICRGAYGYKTSHGYRFEYAQSQRQEDQQGPLSH